MSAPASRTRRPAQERPWALVTMVAGFVVAAVCVIAVGIVSLELNPLLQ
ncbi:hypothetical protein GMA12_15995 [Kocuria sediminis]|uniref:Uncharacterized protein n=1 Tax=Kocuria sediminis TaxID=1038857 RepID=A0A6N8GUM4_9MICC|nr:hypothetical protein [Kocuria sediminis]MUN64625.1 hypothetical protein [Kocuria sediminis]